jgi:hypothetical protein
MTRKKEKGVSRRTFLEFGTGAVAATAGLLAVPAIAQQGVKTGRQQPSPILQIPTMKESIA